MFLRGDSKQVLSNFADNTFDLIVTDPPYGISFMGKDWDKALPDPEIWKQCFRVLKEGKLAFIMCSPRQDVLSRMIISLETAGFRTNYTSIYWTFASGFPKAKNNRDGSYVGFQPKPAVEVILVVSKGKTLTWLDDCRIPYQSEQDKDAGWHKDDYGFGYREWSQRHGYDKVKVELHKGEPPNQKGRFPANLLVSDDVLNHGKITKSGLHKPTDKQKYKSISDQKWGFIEGYHNPNIIGGDSGSYSRYFSLDSWAESKTFPFIITPKASKSEKNKGCENIEPEIKGNQCQNMTNMLTGSGNIRATKFNNHHPTVKPLKLFSYLITMGSREGDLILDPFIGSGTTYLASVNLHRECIGIELNPEYIQIAKARVKPLLEQNRLIQ